MSKFAFTSQLALFGLTSSLVGCSADPWPDSDATANDGTVELAEQAAIVAPVQAYFTITRDMRLCPSAKCGGYWVKAVNRTRTVCANGTTADSCYVAAIDYKAMGGDPQIVATTVVVQGKLGLVSYAGLGKLGVLSAVDAWGSATAIAPTGTYYRLTDTGIVCVTSPCFNVNVEALNLGTTTSISAYDFRKVGATAEQLKVAELAMDDGRLLAAGSIASVITPTQPGRLLTATQIHLPARDFCYSDQDCARTAQCNASTVCLPPPGCGPNTSCPAVCTGYCIPLVANCISNADCASHQFCDTDPCLPAPGCTPGSICPTVCGGVCSTRL